MVKIQSQSGNSLADTYDVEGSIAGIDQLLTKELPIVHEMGATVFSERFTTAIRRVALGSINQSTEFAVNLTDLPATPSRLLGVSVVSDVGANIARAAVMVRDPTSEREFPVWVFDGSTVITIKMDDNGTETDFDLLVGQASTVFTPTFVGGVGQPGLGAVNELIIRGETTAFGAGTVLIRAFYHIALVQLGGISSRGLPLPSW